MELRKAAEFICSFDTNNVLKGFKEKTFSFNGEIRESNFIKLS